ncbi:MAG: carboxypeptidase-like regulatory domain-containing protein [Pyrinomonadaceae bacterium]
MNFKLIISLVFILLVSIEINAQPGCGGIFNPYNYCRTNYKEADYIIFGEKMELDTTIPTATINGKCCYKKTKIEVKKILKGKLNKKVIELYRDIDAICNAPPPVGTRQIFNVNKTIIDGQIVYYSPYISTPMTDYSDRALREVFAEVRANLRNKRKKSLEGYVSDDTTPSQEVRRKKEENDRYDFRARNFILEKNVLVEAKNKETNKVYRTRSDDDGAYRFDDLPNGEYILQAYPDDGKVGEISNITVNDLRCSRRHNIYIYPKDKQNLSRLVKKHKAVNPPCAFLNLQNFLSIS